MAEKKGKEEGRFVSYNDEQKSVFKNKVVLWVTGLIVLIIVVLICLYLVYYFGSGSSGMNATTNANGNVVNTGGNAINTNLSSTTGKVSLDIEMSSKPKFWSWFSNLF